MRSRLRDLDKTGAAQVRPTFPTREARTARERPRSSSESARISEKPTLLLCFSHLRWDFVWQRPQHLLTRAARNATVVMLEEPIWRDCPEPHLHVSERPGGIRVAVPVLPDATGGRDVVRIQKRLLDEFLSGEPKRRLLAWYYTAMALAFSAHLKPDLVVYDNMDELSAFRGASPEMLANEAALMKRADVVFTGGQSLYEAKKDRHPRVSAHPSSIDRAHFAIARDWVGHEPEDQADIPGPRIGFFGVMDERLDVELVDRVAELRPDWSIVMLGPVVKIDPETLPRRPNIHWLGFKTYADLPAYLAGWDLGFMPFALNESTRFISPTKTPEYLAAGLPLISTPIADVIEPYGAKRLVSVCRTARQVVARADRILSAGPRPGWLRAVDAHLAQTSWDLTWERMQDEMAAAAAARPAKRGRTAGRAGGAAHV